MPSRSRRALRARTHILVLIIACLLPMLGLALVSSERLAESARQASEAQILSTARALAAAVDVRLKTGAAELATLGTARSMREHDFARLYEQAVAVGKLSNAVVVLTDADGRTVFNSRLPFDAPLPTPTSLQLVREVARTGTMRISDVFIGISSQHQRIAVMVPVPAEGPATHVLNMSYDIAEISNALVEQNLPPSWTATIIDRNGRILGRNHGLETYAGQPASPAFTAEASGKREAVFTGPDREGTQLLTAFTTSAYSGWRIALGIPLTEVEAPFRRSMLAIVWAAGAMLLLGVLVAWLIGRRMAQSMRQLSASALALGTGTPIAQRPTHVREIDDVVLALHAAEDLLRRREAERDKAERELRHGEERFRDMAECSSDWAWETGPDFRFTYHRGDTGGRERLAQHNVLGKTRWELCELDPASDPELMKHQRDLEAHLPFRGVRLVTYADGVPLYLSVSGRPYFDETGDFQGYRGITTDETAMVLASQRAEQAEAMLRDAIDSIAAGLTIFDAEDRLVMFNDGNSELFGADLHMRRGMSFEEVARGALRRGHYGPPSGDTEPWLAERIARHRAATGSTEQCLANGRWILVTERRMRNGGIVSLRVDITALKAAQAALRESEERLERAQMTAKIGSWEVDIATGRYLWSKEMYRLRGLPESAEPEIALVIETTHPDDRARSKQWMDRLKAGETMGTLEFRLRRADGEERIVRAEGITIRDAEGKIVRVSGTLHDVTEFRRAEQRHGELERQLLHSQKLEALGTLAGGIAHDLNNTLVPVITMAKLGLNAAKPDSRLHQDFALIYEAGKRARDLVKQVLAYSRKEVLQPRRFRLDGVLSEALAMLRPTVPATIIIEADIEAVPEIFGDPGQFHQVILNLVTNAVQAIDNQLGTITITLAAVPPPGTPAALPAGAPGPAGSQAPTLRLTVGDTGCGMPPEIQRRIFEPFFTTKAVGDGTGLGLAVAHGIVTSHGGTITVASTVGEGTVFTVELPSASAVTAPEGAASPAAPSPTPSSPLDADASSQQRIRA
ncbi:MAG: PAS domain S-box protein [Alphaproteobacteria bacterium]|nr:PAS domain S-box protein [Alphaproteobacteria bacterium]